MKRKLTAVFSVIALLLLASCGTTDTPADDQDVNGGVIDTNIDNDTIVDENDIFDDGTDTPAE